MPMDKYVYGTHVWTPPSDFFLIKVAARHATCFILRALFPDDSTSASPLPYCYG
jgi:hypothetical protein